MNFPGPVPVLYWSHTCPILALYLPILHPDWLAPFETNSFPTITSCFSESRIRRDSDTSSLRCSSVTSHLEGPAVKSEDDEKPLLLTPDSFITHTSGPTQSATVVDDSVATTLTASMALNTLPPILPQKHSTFENESTKDVCNCTDDTSVGLSQGRAVQSLEPREKYQSESMTRTQCDGGIFVREKRMDIEENPNSDNEKDEVTYHKIKRNNQTRNTRCSPDVLEGDDEFRFLNAERKKRTGTECY